MGSIPDSLDWIAKNISVRIASVVVAVAVVSAAVVWLCAHLAAAPGTTVSVLYGLASYQKCASLQVSLRAKETKSDDPFKRALQPGDSAQWQWAGENWLGTVTIEPDSRARISVNKIQKVWEFSPTGRTQRIEQHRLFSSSNSGSVRADENGIQVDLPIQVEQTWAGDPIVRIEGSLARVRAYAGKVRYYPAPPTSSNPNVPPEVGDMVLVDWRGSLGP